MKREFGKDCAFRGGGVNTAGTLNEGRPENIREQELEHMEIFSR